MSQDIFFPPGVQARFCKEFDPSARVPNEIPESLLDRYNELWKERNECEESEIARIDDEFFEIAVQAYYAKHPTKIGPSDQTAYLEMALISLDNDAMREQIATEMDLSEEEIERLWVQLSRFLSREASVEEVAPENAEKGVKPRGKTILT